MKGLVEGYVANVETLAESLSVRRRKPVVDGDGAIIRPATYQRKETELDAEVDELEANIEGINAFTDRLIGILKNTDELFEPAAGIGWPAHRIDGIGDGNNEKSGDSKNKKEESESSKNKKEESGESKNEKDRDDENKKSKESDGDQDVNAEIAEPNRSLMKKILTTLFKIMKELERKLTVLKARRIE